MNKELFIVFNIKNEDGVELYKTEEENFTYLLEKWYNSLSDSKKDEFNNTSIDFIPEEEIQDYIIEDLLDEVDSLTFVCDEDYEGRENEKPCNYTSDWTLIFK